MHNIALGADKGCSEELCFFPRMFNILRLRQHWAVIGCTKNGQPIGVTVHSHYFESLLQLYLD